MSPSFDPDFHRQYQVFDNVGLDRVKLEDPMSALSNPLTCSSLSGYWLMRNAVSYHIHFKSSSMLANVALIERMAATHREMHLADISHAEFNTSLFLQSACHALHGMFTMPPV